MAIFKSLLKNKHLTYFCFLAANLFVLTNNVFAQSIGFTNPASNDMSVEFLNQIFGSIVNGGTDAFGSSILTFNGAVLTVGGILAAYTILAGTLGTAHDGEMLGKKFSSVWIPIRYAMGTALVLPVLPGGYCVMQGLVMWLVMQGVSLANMVWSTYMANPPALMVKVSPTSKENIRKFVQDVYLAQVCVESNKQGLSQMPPILYGEFPSGIGGYDFGVVKTGKKWGFGDLNSGYYVCGEVTEPKKPEIKVSNAAATPLSSMSGVETLFKTADLTPLHTAHLNQIQQAIDKTEILAGKAILDPTTVSVADIDSISNSYVAAIESAAASVANNASSNNNSMTNAANKQGWFLAGSWVTQIILAQNKINSMVNVTPASNIKVANVKDSISDEVKRYQAKGYSVLAGERSDILGLAENTSNKVDESKDTSTSEIGIGGKVSQFLSKYIVGIDIESIKTDTRHPLIIMTQIGDSIFTSILWGMGAAFGAAVIGGVKVMGNGVDFAPAFISFYGTLAFPLAAFIGVAAMLSYILPNMPFLIWIGIIIGWTIMVVEAILAAPLWAVMHLHPNGDDLTGRGGNGYMLVLGLLLRPVLIIFGLIAAIILSGLFGQLINRVFFDVFSANVGDEGLGFFAMIFGTAVYAGAMFLIIKHTFALMHVIPDQMLRWIGGGGEQLGQYAGSMGEGTMGKASAAGGAVAAYVAKDALSQIGNTGREFKQLSVQKEQTKAQKESAYQDADFRLGAGMGQAQRTIDSKGSGLGAGYDAQKAKSEASFASSMLGGEHSISYNERLNDNLNSGQSFKEAHEGAFGKTYDEKYGAGSFEVAQQVAGGSVSGAASRSSLARTSAGYDAKLSKMIKGAGMDPDSAREALGQFNHNVLSTHAQEGGNIKNILQTKSQELNQELGLQSGIAPTSNVVEDDRGNK